MKSILVPTDFSSCANEATKMAMAIAQKTRACIYFLHLLQKQSVVSYVPHVGHYDPIAESEEKQINQSLMDLVNRVASSNLIATPILEYGFDIGKINDHIASHSIDLIVMGSHGSHGIKEIFLGSNAQRVVRQALVPVLVVKAVKDYPEIKSVVFATALREDMSIPLAKVVELASLWNAEINVLLITINTYLIDDSLRRELKDQLAMKFPGVAFTINSIDTNDEEWGITSFVEMCPTDLIAISKNEYSGEFKMLSENIAELLVNHESTPVLVV